MSTYETRTAGRKVVRIHRAECNGNYTRVPNHIVNDRTISPAAGFVLCWMLSKPDHWKFTRRGVAKWFGFGDHTLRRIFRELERAGYLRRRQTNAGAFGDVEYEVFVDPAEDAPLVENQHAEEVSENQALPETPSEETPVDSELSPLVGFPHVGNQRALVKTNRQQILNQQRIESSDSAFDDDDEDTPPPRQTPTASPRPSPPEESAGPVDMAAVRRRAMAILAADRGAAKVIGRLVDAAEGDSEWADGVLTEACGPKVRNRAALVLHKANERQREAKRASGVYQPGDTVTVHGETYTANENGRFPYHVRVALEAEREQDRPAYWTPEGFLVAGTGRYRDRMPDGRLRPDPGL